MGPKMIGKIIKNIFIFTQKAEDKTGTAGEQLVSNGVRNRL